MPAARVVEWAAGWMIAHQPQSKIPGISVHEGHRAGTKVERCGRPRAVREITPRGWVGHAKLVEFNLIICEKSRGKSWKAPAHAC